MKKISSFFLAVIIAIAAIPMNAFADETEDKIITGAKVHIDTDQLVGKTRDEFIELVSTDTTGIEIDKENFLIIEYNGTFSETDKYEYSVNYSAQIHLYPQEGYKLSDDMTALADSVTVEGRRAIVNNDANCDEPNVSVHYATPAYAEHITVNFSFRATGPMNVVNTIDISFDTEIDGKTPDDYKDFISVNTEGVEMGSENFWVQLNNPGWPGVVPVVETYELDNIYYSSIYIYPEDGYAFPNPVSVTVNGEKTAKGDSVYVYDCEYETVTDTTDESCKYMKVYFEYKVTGPVPEPTFSEKLSQAFSNFFLSIATFFTETFIQPIIDFFMEIA